MAVAELISPEIRSFDDVLERLGGISPKRIAAFPPPGAATEDDLLRSSRGRIYELADGVLVEKMMSTFESTLATVLIQLLRNHLDEHLLGTTVGEAGMLRLMPGLIRAPDVSFISWDRFPGRQRPQEAIYSIAPDLAVEIISEGNTLAEMNRKLREYFSAGARLVWYIYPETRSAAVYTSPDDHVLISQDGSLSGGDILPGFQLSIREWFERAWPEELPGF